MKTTTRSAECVGQTDCTPLETRIVLVAVLLVTLGIDLAMLGRKPAPASPAAVAPLLWLFTVLFVLRVAGQVLVALKPRSWLPPMVQWNLVPYPVLLPIQLLLIVLMVWIDLTFSHGAPEANPGLGRGLLAFSAVYAAAMPVRYAIRMTRRPEQRWFGGTIPMVFHIVLASYLLALGRFHAAG
jgi:hypothetical protein